MAKDWGLHHASFWSKLRPVPGLMAAITVNVLLAVQIRRNYTTLWTFVNWNRTAVQVAVQIIAHALGLLQIFTLTSILNFSTRLRLSRGSVSLSQLRLWQLISSAQMAWSLPPLHLAVLVPYIAFHLLPSALWAGAITPVASSEAVPGYTQVPMFSPDPHNQFWNHSGTGTLNDWLWPVTRNAKGVFSYTPAPTLQGVILNTAATASSGTFNHPKNDNSRLHYLGRSFGVGASVGLEDGFFPFLSGASNDYVPSSRLSVLGYRYQETGYSSTVHCIRNISSGWFIASYSNATDATFPNEYVAWGTLPNSAFNPDTKTFTDEDYVTLGLRNDSQIVALIGLSHTPSNIFAIATGNGTYNVLDKVQCEVYFTPSTFDVFVNLTSLTINVTPLSNSTVDMDPTSVKFGSGLGVIPQLTMRQVTFLSMMNTNLYTSALGNVFMTNINDLATVRNTAVNDTDTVMDAVAASLESMIDDILVALGSAQLEIGAPRSASMAAETITQQSVPALRIGDVRYIIAVAAMNVFIAGIYLVELLRTRGWRHMPVFDYTDLFSVVVATSRGGMELGEEVKKAHDARGTVWVGNPRDRTGERTRLELASLEGMPMFVPPQSKDALLSEWS